MKSMSEVPQTAGSSRVAFFGGSFDPPHRGHLDIAREARQALGLDQVLFAPVGQQPLKPGGSSASFAERVAMTRLAIVGEPSFALSMVDAPNPQGQPNYSLHTLERLQDKLGPGCTLYCLMGADSFAHLRLWWRAAEIPFVATLVVAARPGIRLDELSSLLPDELVLLSGSERNEICNGVPLRSFVLQNRQGATARFYLLPALDCDISATRIRALLKSEDFAARAELARLLPDAVTSYLLEHKLYRA
jgi:nicotinate-nucleotide adenylyltransferase